MRRLSRTWIAVLVGVLAALAVTVAIRLTEDASRATAIPPLIASSAPSGTYRGTTDQDQTIEVIVGTGGATVRYDVIVSCEPGGLVTRHESFTDVTVSSGKFAATRGADAAAERASVSGELEAQVALGEIRETLKGTPLPASVCTLPNQVVHWTASRQ